MKHFFPFLIILFCACSEDSSIETINVQVAKTDYSLNFDISKVDYQSADNSPTHSITTTQSTDKGLRIESLTEQEVFYYFFNNQVSEDSINLIGSLHFTNDNPELLKTDELLIQFVYQEAKSNVTQLADSSYVYESNLALFTRLSEIDWNNQKLFTDQNIGQFVLLIPNSTELDLDWHPADYLSSNGFYFDYETLNIESIEFDYLTGDISLNGNFNVDLKILSCGFYSFYKVENAVFEAKILNDI